MLVFLLFLTSVVFAQDEGCGPSCMETRNGQFSRGSCYVSSSSSASPQTRTAECNPGWNTCVTAVIVHSDYTTSFINECESSDDCEAIENYYAREKANRKHLSVAVKCCNEPNCNAPGAPLKSVGQ